MSLFKTALSRRFHSLSVLLVNQNSNSATLEAADADHSVGDDSDLALRYSKECPADIQLLLSLLTGDYPLAKQVQDDWRSMDGHYAQMNAYLCRLLGRDPNKEDLNERIRTWITDDRPEQ